MNADWKISDKAWTWCVLEMRDKAMRFAETGRVVVFDYVTGVCKADLGCELLSLLRSVVDEIVDKEPAKGRPCPDRVAHVVDAHLAPLAYGRTRVLSEGGAVGLEDMDEWYGRGELSVQPEEFKDYPSTLQERSHLPEQEQEAISRSHITLGTLAPRFQWLPCEVAFAE